MHGFIAFIIDNELLFLAATADQEVTVSLRPYVVCSYVRSMFFSNMLYKVEVLKRGQGGQVGSSGIKWGQVGSSGVKWGQVGSSGVKCGQLGSIGVKCGQMGLRGSIGIKLGQSGVKWD
jgi:hypothetical protein